MPKSWARYLRLWERFWAKGNYPFNGELTPQDKISIKKVYLRLNAEHAVKRYKKYASKIKNLGD